MKNVFSLFLLFSLFSCESKEKANKSILEVGRYVYQDNNGTIHIDANCLYLNYFLNDGKDNGVKRVLSDGINPKYLEKTCPRCIDDASYERLEQKKGDAVVDSDSIDWEQFVVK